VRGDVRRTLTRRMTVILWRRIMAMPCNECAKRLGLRSHGSITGDVLKWQHAELVQLEHRLELELRRRFTQE
jgi:hypothetical protein